MTTYRTTQEERQHQRLTRELADAANMLALAEQRMRDAVAMCRAEDADGACLVSWADIGQALGVSKQAAQQRFRRLGIT